MDSGKKEMAEKESKTSAVIFSAAEQKMLMELYDQFNSVITRKGNTTAINKSGNERPQTTADRLNE